MGTDDSKRFYWLKLRKDFFQQHQIKVLKSLPNGRLYALIYLELLAESTSHNGELRYSQMLPYDINTLAKVIDEDNDNLKCAIDTLIKLELVEILEDKTIYLREINKLIGSETGQTIRKNLAKLESGKNYQKNTKENRVKSIENRVKNIYSEEQLNNSNFMDSIKGFMEMRIKQKKPLTDRALQMIINKLNKYDVDYQIKMLNQSILHSWLDVYEVKDNKTNKKVAEMPKIDF